MRKTRSQPKYVKVREQLRAKITSGAWPCGSQIPGTEELMKSLKVSDSTVKHALRNLVQEGLIIRRKKAGSFVADPQDPPVIPGRNLRLGLLLHIPTPEANQDSGLLMNTLQGVLAGLGIRKVEPEYSTSARGSYSSSIWRQPARGISLECIGPIPGVRARTPPLKVVRESRFDGLMTLGIIDDYFLDRILKLGAPSVLIDFPTPAFGMRSDMVYADPMLGYQQAIEQLVAQGMKRIFFIGSRIHDPKKILKVKADGKKVFGKRIDPDTFLRLSAYRQAMDAQGIEVPESWVRHVSFYTPDRVALARELAALPEGERPEAVVCQDTKMADFFLDHFEQWGHALAGAGGAGGFRFGRSLGIRLDGHQMGRTAVELLVNRLKDPGRAYLNVGVRMMFDEVTQQTKAPAHL